MEIANHELKSSDIPPADADWETIGKFALSYNGYNAWGSFEKCDDIANAQQHGSLAKLRTCLFLEQRRWRHYGDDPDDESMAYIRSLVEMIRETVEAKKSGGGKMVHNDFTSFMLSEVLPRQAANPEHVRLDGAKSGGNRDVAGRFMHDGLTWVVHADTHYEPLAIAFKAAQSGVNSFVQEKTVQGYCLALTPDLRQEQSLQHKYLYIYSWSTTDKASTTHNQDG